MEKQKTNAVIYARYSSHAQNEQSIEEQIDAGKKYADEHGYTVVNEYCDAAVSGRTDEREAFQKMIKDSAQHTFSVVITWKVDRIGRSREDIVYNKYRLKKNGARIEYVAENLPEGPEAVILEAVLEGMAEYYSLSMAQNIMRGLRKSAEKGIVLGMGAQLGYKKGPDKRYMIDEATAPIVKEIFRRYLMGKSIKAICIDLNSRGLKTIRGGSFNKSNMERILSNEIYKGVYKWSDIRIEDGVPPLISKDDFERVQMMMAANKKKAAGNRGHKYLLSGKCHCGLCGATMRGVYGKGKAGTKYYYYQCGKSKEGKCENRPIRCETVESEVNDTIEEVLHDKSILETVAHEAYQIYLKDSAENDKLKATEAELKEVQKSIDNIVRTIESGACNPSLTDRLSELEEQKNKLSASIAKEKLDINPDLTEEHILFFLEQFREDPRLNESLVNTFIKDIIISPGELRIQLYDGSERRSTADDIVECSTSESNKPLYVFQSNTLEVRIFRGFFEVQKRS